MKQPILLRSLKRSGFLFWIPRPKTNKQPPPNKNKSKQNKSVLEDKEPTDPPPPPGPTQYNVPIGFFQMVGSDHWFASHLGYVARLQDKKRKFPLNKETVLLLFPRMANPQHPDFPFLKSNENVLKTCLVLWLCGQITSLCSSNFSVSHS